MIMETQAVTNFSKDEQTDVLNLSRDLIHILYSSRRPKLNRVLFEIVSNMDDDNRYISTDEAITKKLGISHNTTRESIRFLIDKNIINISREGKETVYKINKDFAFMGFSDEVKNKKRFDSI